MNSPIPRLLLASGNPHKLQEIRTLLNQMAGPDVVELLTPADFPLLQEPEETGRTFEENAELKARYWADQTGLAALADDSGLVVDALAGEPGVRSARYAPTVEERNRLVLEKMRGVVTAGRTARFVCVVALVDPVGACVTRRGEVFGRITEEPRGSNGFGYDPIFELAEGKFAGRTMAELTGAEKNANSHRGRALQLIAPVLAECLRTGRLNNG